MTYQDIIANFQAQQEAAKAANEARYAESLEIYDEIIKQYQPEGGFLTGAQQELEREKGRTIAGQEQKLVSSGLFGTSVTAGLGSKWESEVGMPARLKLEDVRMGRLAEALQSKAGAIERRDDIGPDYSTIAALSQGAASGPMYMPQQATGSGYDQLAAEREASAQRQASAYAQTSAQRFQERMFGQQTSAASDAARLDYQRQLRLAQAGGTQAVGTQPSGGGYGTSQLSQNIFGAMSGFASQAAGTMGAGGTSAQMTQPPKYAAYETFKSPTISKAEYEKRIKQGGVYG